MYHNWALFALRSEGGHPSTDPTRHGAEKDMVRSLMLVAGRGAASPAGE